MSKGGRQSNVPAAVERHVTTTAWQGPVPPPEVTEYYNRIVPNGADRIFTMAEEESRVRREQVKRDHDSQNRVKETDVREYHASVKRGQVFACIVLLAIVAAIIVCAANGLGGAAAAVAGMGAAGIVTNFIGRKK